MKRREKEAADHYAKEEKFGEELVQHQIDHYLSSDEVLRMGRQIIIKKILLREVNAGSSSNKEI